LSVARRAAVALVLVSALVSGCGGAVSCPGISPETAQHVFDRMKQVAVGSGYRFEGVGTEQSHLVVQWSSDGKDCPPISVDVENCASALGLARLQLHVPSDLSARCPGLTPVVTELAGALSAEHPVGQHLSLTSGDVRLLIAAIAVILVAGLLIRRLLGPPRRWGDVAWICIALLAAVPFFFNVPLAVTVELGTGWIAFALLLLDRQLLAAQGRPWQLSLLALFFFALLLSWSLSSGGPGDLRLNLAAIWSPGIELRWGPAPIALFRMFRLALGGLQDTTILWCNLILGSLLPVLLALMAVELGIGATAALAAGCVVAAHPLLLAFSGVLERQPTYLFAACGSLLALIGFLQRAGGWRLVAFILGAVLATTARPEGAHVLVLYAVALLLLPASRRIRAAAAIALALLAVFAFVYTRYALEMHPAGGKSFWGQAPILWTVLFSRDFTPLAWIVAWTAGLVVSVRQRAAWFAVLTLLGLDLVWRWADVYSMFVGYERQVCSARYESILLVPFVIGVGLLIQAVLQMRTRWKLGLAAFFIVFTAATFQRPYETLLRPFTVDHEYRFLKKYASTLPPGARLYVFDAPFDDMGFLDAHLVGQFTGSAVRFASWSARDCAAERSDAAPAYLYIGSSCGALNDAPGRPLPVPSYERWLQDCTAMRVRLAADVVEQIEVPAHKMSWHEFKESRVQLGLYRLSDPSLCALQPAGLNPDNSREPLKTQPQPC